ncbi:YfgM family protein [Candidatus Pseudomonas adelgestsugas]|nr:tetratricopeptide repeat protein [Candidatus Pseudomonas adelgestsugas]
MLSADDDQLSEFKDWWKRNCKLLVIGGLFVLVVVFGRQAWYQYQANQSRNASTTYQQLLEIMLILDDKLDLAQVVSQVDKLKHEFRNSTYAQYGSLFVAKVAVDTGKLDDAVIELKTISEKSILGEIARHRLAKVLAAQNKTNEALKLLSSHSDKTFTATCEELKGDLLVQIGDLDGAYAAYQAAQAELSDKSAVGVLQIKLDNLAKGDT